MTSDASVRKFTFDDKEYKIIKPTNKIRKESDAVYASAYRKALLDGYFLQSEIDDILDQRGFSDKEFNKKRNALVQNIRILEKRLVDEDYNSPEDGKELALEIIDIRNRLTNMVSPRLELEGQSVERRAENMRFSFFAYKCSLDENGKNLWKDFSEFENDESELAFKVASELLMMLYGISEEKTNEEDKQRTEIRWLLDNKLVDDELSFINADGHKVDRDGRLIDDNGNYIDKNGQRIDIYGNPLDEDGNLISIKSFKSTEKKPRKKPVPTAQPIEA